jgi:DNA-binding MarR family transcriptional regulator
MARDSIAEVLREWHDIAPELDVAPVGVIARMARIRAIVEREQARIFSGAGITPADFPLLVTLRRRHPPYRMIHTQLAASTGLTAGTVTTRVDRLAELLLVDRRPDPDDARIRWVTLTEQGVDLVQRLIPQHLAAEHELLAGVPESVRARLARDLSTLLADLEARYA